MSFSYNDTNIHMEQSHTVLLPEENTLLHVKYRLGYQGYKDSEGKQIH